MERMIKKIVAIVLTIALVVSTLSIQPNTAKAATDIPLGWATVGQWQLFAGEGAWVPAKAQYSGSGKSFSDMAITISETQNEQWGLQFGYTITDTLTAGTQYDYTMVINSTMAGTMFTQVPGVVTTENIAIKQGDNTISGTFTAGANPARGNIMIFPNGMPAGTTLDMKSLTVKAHTGGGTVDEKWVKIDKGEYNGTNTYSYDDANKTVSSVGNIQKPGWAASMGIHIVLPAAPITAVTVNGQATNNYAADGAGLILYLSALSEGENTVAITHANGTSTITIKQEGSGTVETPVVTTSSSSDDDGYYTIPAANETFYVGDGTWRLYSSNSVDQQVWGSGIMKYKGGTSDSDLSLKIVNTGGGLDSWSLQAHYIIKGLTAGQKYTYTVNYTTTNAGTMRYKIDGTGAADQEDVAEKAGTVSHTHTFTAAKESDEIVFELSAMPNGTIINFNSIKVTAESSGETTSSSSEVERPEDVTAWKPVTNSSQVFYYVTNGADGRVDTPLMETSELYVPMKLSAVFQSVTLDGVAMTPSDGAYVRIPKNNLTVGYHTLTVVNNNNTETLTMYFKVDAQAETTTPEPITIPEITDGTELLKDTAFEEGNVSHWDEFGPTSYKNNGDGTLDVQVPAYTAGDNWATQLVQKNIQLYEGKWYVARFTVTSDVDKSFQLLIQSDGNAGGDWTVFAEELVEVSAGGEQVVEIQFQATSTTANVLYGIMMGYVNGTASDAANVKFKDVSLKVYNDEQQISGTHSNLLTSNDVSVQGFQMKTNWDEAYTGDTQFGFRTVCQAPNIGGTVRVNNVSYTVAQIGTIYTIEGDKNLPAGVTFDSTCTLLRYDEETGKYVPSVDTFGYMFTATDKGIVAKDNVNSTYVQTIEGLMKQFPMANKIHVRAFVVTTGGTIIYGRKSVNTSVARVAAYMYNKSMATNIRGHEYLFDNFVNVNNFAMADNPYFTSKANPYYSNKTIAYGWNDNLYTPGGEKYMNLKPDIYLEDNYLNATTGWHEDPASVNTNTRGDRISVAGLKFDYGISTNAVGYFEYEVPYNAAYFVGIVGIDDSIAANPDYKNGATIRCEVSFDGAEAYTTKVLSYGQLEYIKVPVPTGASTVKITFGDAGDGQTCDRASMGNAGWMIDESIEDKYDTSKDPKDITRIYVYTDDDNPKITKENKLPANITIISGESGVNSVTDAGTIKLRGNSTALADKPAYNISFKNKHKLFADASEGKKWCLLANAFDKTLLRNKLAMDLGKYLGGVAAPEERFADLYINGKLKGSYLISEPAENGRSGIQYDETNDTDMLFELEVEKVEADVLYNITDLGVRFAVEDIAEDSVTYTNYKTTLKTFETALQNTSSDEVFNLIDVDSFVSMYIVNELFKTVDFGYSSVKFYIQKNADGKPIIHAGSLWDFDLSTGNSSVEECRTTTDFRGQTINTWFGWLMRNNTFKNKVIAKFTAAQETIQNIYQANGLGDSWINKNLAYMGKSKDRNYSDTSLGGAGWNINTPDSAEYKYYPYGYNTLSPYINYTYEQHINYLVNWLSERNQWMCKQWGIN